MTGKILYLIYIICRAFLQSKQIMMDTEDLIDVKVCFVCGSLRHSDQYLLNIKPRLDSANEPYFPFLEKHDPPTKYIVNTLEKQVGNWCS